MTWRALSISPYHRVRVVLVLIVPAAVAVVLDVAAQVKIESIFRERFIIL